MKRFILFWALLVLIAAPVWAADTNKYPSTLIDETCTDLYDAPAAYTPGLTIIGGPSAPISSAALVQTSGDPDQFCDNDSRIVAVAVTALDADVVFGPFRLAEPYIGIHLFVYVSDATGGTTAFRVQFESIIPHTGAVKTIYAINDTGVDDYFYIIGGRPYTDGTILDDDDIHVPIPEVFYIRMDFIAGGATSITTAMSLYPFK
jgi:hypothetical protein